jgi:hypothetical protein
VIKQTVAQWLTPTQEELEEAFGKQDVLPLATLFLQD